MKPSHLRQRIWSQPLVPLRRPYPVSRPVHSEASRCAFSQIGLTLARRRLLRISANRAFASHSIVTPEVSSALRSTSRSTKQTTSTGRVIYSARPAPRSISYQAQQAWRAGIYSKRPIDNHRGSRNESSSSKSGSGQKPAPDDKQSSPVPPEAKNAESPHPESSPVHGKYLHLSHLPKMPHRPTKEELLAAATGFWSRLKVRFKWFSIRSVRPWNVDDWSAFVSWFVLGNIVWILVGTTTFFSLVILSINTVVAQGMLFFAEEEDYKG